MKTYAHLTYFKKSGKYYSEAEYTSELELDYEIYEEVRRMVSGYRGVFLDYLQKLGSIIYWFNPKREFQLY